MRIVDVDTTHSSCTAGLLGATQPWLLSSVVLISRSYCWTITLEKGSSVVKNKVWILMKPYSEKGGVGEQRKRERERASRSSAHEGSLKIQTTPHHLFF
jgi:hypothetical protein